jgi:hypothetical protein
MLGKRSQESGVRSQDTGLGAREGDLENAPTSATKVKNHFTHMDIKPVYRTEREKWMFRI